jgi:hypothetical protein
MDNEKLYECNSCSVQFAINIEPGKERADLEKCFPEALTWARHIEWCPVCMGSLEEIE